MSNYLTQLKINNLQAELDAAMLAQGFVTPMVVNVDGNGKAIQNLGIISAAQGTLANVNAGSITTTGAVSAASLSLSTDLTVPGLKTQSVFAPTGTELNLDNTTAGERIFVGYASSGTKVYTGELHPQGVLAGSISCTQLEQTTNGGDPAGTFQAGIREGVVTADGLIINTIGAHDNPSITFTSPIVLAAGQVFTGLDVNFLSIGNALYMGSGTSMSCATAGDRFTITDVQIENTNYVALNNQQAGGLTLSVSANVVDTKSMLTVVDNTGTHRGNIYDSYYNPPPGGGATTLTEVLANGSSAGNQKITNVEELDAGVIQGGIIQVLPTGQTSIGNVFDSLYNPPTIAGPIIFTNGGGGYNFAPGVAMNVPIMNFSFPPPFATLSYIRSISLYLTEFNFNVSMVSGISNDYVFWIGIQNLSQSVGFSTLPSTPSAYFNLDNATNGDVDRNTQVILSFIQLYSDGYTTDFTLYFGPQQAIPSAVSIRLDNLTLTGELIGEFSANAAVTTSIP